MKLVSALLVLLILMGSALNFVMYVIHGDTGSLVVGVFCLLSALVLTFCTVRLNRIENERANGQ